MIVIIIINIEVSMYNLKMKIMYIKSNLHKNMYQVDTI